MNKYYPGSASFLFTIVKTEEKKLISTMYLNQITGTICWMYRKNSF